MMRRFGPVVLAGMLVLPSVAVGAPAQVESRSDDLVFSVLPEGGQLTTISGEVRVSSSGGALSVSSVSGDIRVGEILRELQVRSVSGDLEIGKAMGPVDVKSISGNVRLNSARDDVQVTCISGNMDVVIEAMSVVPHVSLKDISGNETLYLPAGFGGTFDIEVYQMRSEARMPLVQSLGLDVVMGPWERRPEWSQEGRKITATGKVGDGRTEVKLRSISGVIRIEAR